MDFIIKDLRGAGEKGPHWGDWQTARLAWVVGVHQDLASLGLVFHGPPSVTKGLLLLKDGRVWGRQRRGA